MYRMYKSMYRIIIIKSIRYYMNSYLMTNFINPTKLQDMEKKQKRIRKYVAVSQVVASLLLSIAREIFFVQSV